MRILVVTVLAAFLVVCFPAWAQAQDGEWFALEPQGEPAYSGWGTAAISDTREVIIAGYISTEGSEGRLFISRNAGEDWTEIFPRDLETTTDVGWQKVAMSATGQVILLQGKALLGSTRKLLYISTDTGETWTEVVALSQDLDQQSTSLAVSGSGQVMLIGNIKDDGKLYRSTDGGENWSVVNPSGNPSDVDWRGVSISGDGQTMLAAQGSTAGGGGGVLYRSTDGGENWTLVLPTGGDSYDGASSTAISQDGEIMIIGQCTAENNNRVYVSLDGGDSWQDAGVQTVFGDCWQVSLSDDGQRALIASNLSNDSHTLLYSEDFGQSWDEAEVDFPSDRFSGIATSGDGYSYLAYGLENHIWQFLSESIPQPTSTPSPSGAPSIGGPRQAVPEPPRCKDSSPTSAPNLFQIDVNNTQATVYFAPVPDADRYYISYGDGKTVGQYGVEFTTGRTDGVIGYTINYLQPRQQYSFVVRSGNGCMPGNWGNTMTITTRQAAHGGASYYKDFLTRVLSVFPQSIIYIDGQRYVLGVANPSIAQATTPEIFRQPKTTVVRPDRDFVSEAVINLGSFSLFNAFKQSEHLAAVILDPTLLTLDRDGVSFPY